MFKKRLLLVVLLALVGTGALADEAAKKRKIGELVDALGYREMFSIKLRMEQEEGRKFGEQIYEEMTRDLSLEPALRARLEKADQSFTKKLSGMWSADKMAIVFGEIFGGHFTEPEIDALLAYYSSELGKKEVLASKQSLVEFTNRFQKDQEVAFAKAMEEYTSELKRIVADTSKGAAK